MSKGFEIQVFNRYENKIEIEKVYGDGAIRFAYGNPIGRMLGPFIASKMFSKLYGNAQDSLGIPGTVYLFPIRRSAKAWGFYLI